MTSNPKLKQVYEDIERVFYPQGEDEREPLRIIANEVPFIDIKEYSHNIISLQLRVLDDCWHDRKLIRKVVRFFGLDEKGWKYLLHEFADEEFCQICFDDEYLDDDGRCHECEIDPNLCVHKCGNECLQYIKEHLEGMCEECFGKKYKFDLGDGDFSKYSKNPKQKAF